MVLKNTSSWPLSGSIGHTLLSPVILQEGLIRTRASVWCLEERTTFVVVVVVVLVELIYILYVWHPEPCTYEVLSWKSIGLDHLCCDALITHFPVSHMAEKHGDAKSSVVREESLLWWVCISSAQRTVSKITWETDYKVWRIFRDFLSGNFLYVLWAWLIYNLIDRIGSETQGE